MTKTWTQCYEEAQAQQFVFENQLSVAIGTPDWHANHTLHHAMLESKSAKQFIDNIDESIAQRMQFDMTASDKARLYQYWCANNVHHVDEDGSDFNVSSVEVCHLADVHNVAVNTTTEWSMFYTKSYADMQAFIESCKQLSQQLGQALTIALTHNESDLTWYTTAKLFS